LLGGCSQCAKGFVDKVSAGHMQPLTGTVCIYMYIHLCIYMCVDWWVICMYVCSLFLRSVWHTIPLRWCWAFLERTWILNRIQFTTHFIEIFVYKSTDESFCCHNKKIDEMLCKLDSTENLRSFEEYTTPP